MDISLPWALLKNLLSDAAPDQKPMALGTIYAAVLVRVARADNDYADTEKRQIDEILAGRFESDGVEAAAIRADGEVFEATAGDTVHITRALKDQVPYEDRADLIADMWRIVLADDARDHEETALMRLIVSLLGVSDKDSALIRQDVIAAST